MGGVTVLLRHRPVSIAPLADPLVGSARRAPDNEAVVFPDQRLTTGEPLTNAVGVAKSLHALGVRRGDRVGILMPNSCEFVDSLFGLHGRLKDMLEVRGENVAALELEIPRRVRFLGDWPMSATKIQKYRLRAELIRELGLTE